VALIPESLQVAHKTRALATRDLERVVADTMAQPTLALAKAGAIVHPTEAGLCYRALENH
jgi:IS5 family transposase